MAKKVRYTEHSKIQIALRELTKEQVDNVLHFPEQVVPDDDNENRDIFQSLFIDHKGKQKLLRVVVEETIAEIIVITVYPTSQIRRYWKE
jgi:hypothetical protein